MTVRNYLNYIGSKDRYLPQILKFIEKGSELTGGSLLMDLCCGSAVVGLNAAQYFENVLCVDACRELIALHNWVKEGLSSDSLVADIEGVISTFGLSKTNKDGFLSLRENYNTSAALALINPVQLYCLITHSYNYSLHINKNHGFNVPFGANRSSFNNSLKAKFIAWKEELDKHPNVRFHCAGFSELRPVDKKVVFFVDPPYSASISKHPYRVGNIKWGEQEDKDLLKFLDEQHKAGNLFVFTNVIKNNGVLNRTLFNWTNEHKGEYFVHPVSIDYTNCSYQRKNNGKTNEVIITNYKGIN